MRSDHVNTSPYNPCRNACLRKPRSDYGLIPVVDHPTARISALLFVLIGGLPNWGQAPPVDAQFQINLDPASRNPFLGVNAAYDGFAFMPEDVNKGMTDATRQIEFDRVSRMGLHIARTFYRPDWACPQAITGPCDWNSTKMQAFYQWLGAMKSIGVTVALNAGWWFPADTYYGQTQPGPSDQANYAAWVSESVRQIVELRGFTNVRYLIVFTEPTTTTVGVLPAGTDLWTYYAACVRTLHQRLLQDGRRSEVLLVGPNNTNNGQDLDRAVSDLNDVLDVYSGHNYNEPGYDQWYAMFTSMQQLVAGKGKPLWADEYGKQDEAFRQTDAYGNYVAQAVAASINAGVQTTLLWLLFDEQYVSPQSTLTYTNGGASFYNGVSRWGTCAYPGDTVPNPGQPRSSWYAFSMMSRYLGGSPGTVSLATTANAGGVFAAATSPGGSDHSILLVNGSSVIRTVGLSFNRALGGALYQYSYTPGEVKIEPSGALIPYGASYAAVGSSLTVTIGPQSVVVLSTLAGSPGTIPSSPSGLVATAGSQSVSLSWKDTSANEEGFRIERRSSDESAFVGIGTVAANVTTFVDTRVNATSYQYRVCAFRTEGCSAYNLGNLVSVGDGRGLIGWWPLMGDLSDKTGQHTSPKAANIVFASDGRNGSSALHLNGLNSFVDLDRFDLGDRFSFALWVKTDDESSVFSSILSNQTPNGFTLAVVNLTPGAVQASSRQVEFETCDTNNCQQQKNALSSSGAFPLGKWIHLAVAVDRIAKTATVYLNGTDVTDSGNSDILGDFSTSGTLRIGSMLSNSYWFHGAIQDLRVYGYLLSDIEVQELAYATLQPTPPTAYTCANTTPPAITFIDSAAGYGGYSYFASGSWLEIKGTNLADPADPRLTASTNSGQWTSSDFNGVNAPTALDGISVSINGKPAYVWYLSPTQLNVQAPEDTVTGNVAITVTNCIATSSQFMFTRRTLAPGLLAPSNYNAGGTQYMVATFASDGAYVLNANAGAAFGLNSRPAKPGDVIIAYGIGFGDVTPSILPGVIVQQSNAPTNPVTLSFGSTNATLGYSGLAGGFVGLYEFYITVPYGLADGDYQINATQNGTKVPQTMYLTVHN